MLPDEPERPARKAPRQREENDDGSPNATARWHGIGAARSRANFGERRIAQPAAAELAFPGAQGWAATTKGGRGGQILRVTNLDGDGPGSFREAIETEGPRIIVFEVGGVIDLKRQTLKWSNRSSPSRGRPRPPGHHLIRGGMDIARRTTLSCSTSASVPARRAPRKRAAGTRTRSPRGRCLQRHRRSLLDDLGDATKISPRPARDSSAPTSEEWRQNTSHRITFTNNIIAEGLAHSTHAKIEHSKGR